MVFKRYSNPFLFLDNLILINQLSEGIDTLFYQVQEERDWEEYLSFNPLNEMSFDELRKKARNVNKTTEESKELSKEDAEEYFKAEKEKSENILNRFKPPKNS